MGLFSKQHKTEVFLEFRNWKFRCSCGAYSRGGPKQQAEDKTAYHERQFTKVR